MKAKLEQVLKDISTARDALFVLDKSFAELDAAAAENKATVLELDKHAERLKSLQAEYAKVNKEKNEAVDTLNSARAALAKLKDMHL